MGKTISSVHAREILDSRGNPTIEVEVCLSTGSLGRAAVPSGASTGAYEAIELRDGDKSRYMGKGVLNAINNVKEKITPGLLEKKFSDQEELDKCLIDLDGTPNKSILGANAVLGVSLAFAKACAIDESLSLFKYLGNKQKYRLPVPLMNVLNGGAHANNGLDVQEFMIVPTCGGSFREALRAGCEVFHNLKSLLNSKGLSTAVGDEGGFAPELKNNAEALDLLAEAVEKAGYKLGEDIHLALDVASTEFFKEGFYNWEGKQITAEEMGEVYAQWARKFPIKSIEDGFAEDDWEGWSNFTAAKGSELQLVGDDLFVTNPQRIEQGLERKAANALLVKVNQIGSLTETTQAVRLAQKNSYATVMSHRSGETEDVTIADLSVAMNCEQIKTGSLCRTDRVAKYNQLLRIEEELGHSSEFWGPQAFS